MERVCKYGSHARDTQHVSRDRRLTERHCNCYLASACERPHCHSTTGTCNHGTRSLTPPISMGLRAQAGGSYRVDGRCLQGLEGKAALETFLTRWCDFPRDVEFLIDEMVEGDASATAVTWHLEVAGKPMPFSRGVSFYRVDSLGRLCFGRDMVRPPVETNLSRV